MECRLDWRPSFPVSFARAKGQGQNLKERLKLGLVRREPQWSENIAVGSREFVEAMQSRVARRRVLVTTAMDVESDIWALDEVPGS